METSEIPNMKHIAKGIENCGSPKNLDHALNKNNIIYFAKTWKEHLFLKPAIDSESLILF